MKEIEIITVSQLPKEIEDDEHNKYKLYLEYHENNDGKFVWNIVYLNSRKLYYRDEQIHFEDIVHNFNKKFAS